MTRVTRLGIRPRFAQDSPNGRLFTLGSFSKMTEVARIFGLHSLAVKCSNYNIKRIGLHLGDFFTNSSGHRGHDTTRFPSFFG
jgi:hypothetical protein